MYSTRFYVSSTRIITSTNNSIYGVTLRGLSQKSTTQQQLPYTERQALKGRPVSPHVTIYRFPITAISSIANRATGVALSVGIAGIGGMALVGVDVPAVASVIGNTFLIGSAAKFAVSFPLIYHYLGAVRHFVWDHFPETLESSQVEKSSYLLFASSTAISLLTILL
eukprot:gene6627-9098_t